VPTVGDGELGRAALPRDDQSRRRIHSGGFPRRRATSLPRDAALSQSWQASTGKAANRLHPTDYDLARTSLRRRLRLRRPVAATAATTTTTTTTITTTTIITTTTNVSMLPLSSSFRISR